MTMTETPAAPKPKRVVRRKAKPAPVEKPAEFAGLTMRDCCAGCDAKRCVISGMNVCGHPYKGSITGADPAVVARIARAKKVLAHQKIDLTG